MQHAKQRLPRLDEAWLAYGPAKDEWKKAGNYYSVEELQRLAESLRDLRIRPSRSVRIHVQ